MSKATHEAWRVGQQFVGGIPIYIGDRHFFTVLPPIEAGDFKRAHLAAAAPDLLAALEEADRVICSALDAAGFYELYPDKAEREAAHAKHITIALIRSAIAKATQSSAGSTGGNSVRKGGRGESPEPERGG